MPQKIFNIQTFKNKFDQYDLFSDTDLCHTNTFKSFRMHINHGWTKLKFFRGPLDKGSRGNCRHPWEETGMVLVF